jgi:hypothetical protein
MISIRSIVVRYAHVWVVITKSKWRSNPHIRSSKDTRWPQRNAHVVSIDVWLKYWVVMLEPFARPTWSPPSWGLIETTSRYHWTLMPLPETTGEDTLGEVLRQEEDERVSSLVPK